MGCKEAARRSGNYGRANIGSRRTRSILADRATFNLVAGTLLFTFAMLLVPTFMAATKQMGWW